MIVYPIFLAYIVFTSIQYRFSIHKNLDFKRRDYVNTVKTILPKDFSHVLITRKILISLLGISHATLSRWINDLQLYRLGEIPKAPNQPFQINMVFILGSAFIGIQYYNIGLGEYKRAVIDQGLGFRFDKVFAQLYGGGNLIESLQAILDGNRLKKNDHKKIIEFMIQYFIQQQAKDKEESNETITVG